MNEMNPGVLFEESIFDFIKGGRVRRGQDS